MALPATEEAIRSWHRRDVDIMPLWEARPPQLPVVAESSENGLRMWSVKVCSRRQVKEVERRVG